MTHYTAGRKQVSSGVPSIQINDLKLYQELKPAENYKKRSKVQGWLPQTMNSAIEQFPQKCSFRF